MACFGRTAFCHVISSLITQCRSQTPVDMAVSLFPSIPHDKLRSESTKMPRIRPKIPPRAEGLVHDMGQHRAGEQQSREVQVAVTSHRMFVRVRASTARFVRSPKNDGAVFPFQFAFLPHWVLPAPSQRPSTAGDPHIDEIRFSIILEPLIMGVLPESTFPGVIFLVAALLVVGIFGLSLVNAAFSKLANRARKGKGKWSD